MSRELGVAVFSAIFSLAGLEGIAGERESDSGRDVGGITILGVPCWGPFDKGILLLGVYIRGPIFS